MSEVEYYLAIKRNKALIHATTWITRGNTVLRERGEAPKTTRGVIPWM